MTWMKQLFGSRKKMSTEQPVRTSMEPQSTTDKSSHAGRSNGWYFLRSSDHTVRQMVMHFPPGTLTETGFGLLILPADKFPILAMNSWCAGFCRISGQNVVMLRAGDFADKVKTAGVTVALSFCHMPSHAVFLAGVRVEAPELTSSIRAQFKHVPPLAKPMAEWISGLSPYDRELIPTVLQSSPIRIVLAKDSSSRNSVFMPNGERRDSAMPAAVAEFQLPVDEQARGILATEWQELLKHADSIPSHRRDFQKATNLELTRILPVDKDPIFAR